MAKLVDALDLGSSGATHRSSSLLTRTTLFSFFCASDNFAIGDYEAKRSGTRSETSGQIGRRTGFRRLGASKRSSSLLTRTTLRVCDASYGAATNGAVTRSSVLRS